MKPPITVEPRTNNVGTHTIKFIGADGEEAELVFVMAQGSSAYQALHEVKEALGELISDFLRRNGVADVLPTPPPAEAAPAEDKAPPAPAPNAAAQPVPAPVAPAPTEEPPKQS